MSAEPRASRGVVPPAGAVVRVGPRTFEVGRPAVMAIINRTTDSFFDGARQLDDGVARRAVEKAVSEGADIVDIGGIKAAPGVEIGAAEEMDRVLPFVQEMHQVYPEVPISVDTWRADVAREACRVGASLINDTWAGHDPVVVEVAARAGAAVVCSHTGGSTPRTRPHRVRYGATEEGVVDDVLATLVAAADRAVEAGVAPESVLIDPTHDFGKNTWHGLALLRHTEALVATGYPVLMALSRKDFIGETLGAPVSERLPGTLGATAVAVWLGARVVRAHDVAETRAVVDMVSSIRGERLPHAVVRGLA